jgi:hypothetical protein
VSTSFTAAEAPDLGVGRGALRGRGVRRELHGVYVPAWAEHALTTSVDAARRVLPDDAQPDGVTALQLLGVRLGSERPLRFVTAHPHQYGVKAFGCAARPPRSWPPRAARTQRS